MQVVQEVRKERVLINGFLIDCDIPTEERLTLVVDITPLLRHVEWISSLQDLLRDIDDAYRIKVFGEAKKPSKKTVKVRYVKDPEGRMRKVASFHPYPSTLVNRFKEIRRSVYSLLNNYCIVLQEERAGRVIKKVYFLPAPSAAGLMADIDLLNERLSGLWREIADFEKTEDFKRVMEHVREAAPGFRGFSAQPSRIRVSPVPLTLSRDFYQRFLEEEEARVMREIEEARVRGIAEVEEMRIKGLEALERELEQKRMEMLSAIERDLKQRFSRILEEIDKAIREMNARKVKAVKKHVEAMGRLVEGLGLIEEPVKAAGKVLEAVEKKDIASLVRAAADLAASFGVKPTGNIERDLEAAKKAASGGSLWLLTID